MTQPTPYTPAYDFSDFQSTNPDDPPPGDKMDIEFVAIQTCLAQIIANLAVIQRDDTGVANQSIGLEQLKNGVVAELDLFSTWTTGVHYAVGDGVYHSNSLYRCLIAHTAGTFATDLAAVKWVLLVNLDQFINLVAAPLSAIAALTPAADKVPYYTSSSAAALATFTSFARTLVDDTDAATARATLGLTYLISNIAGAAPVVAASASGTDALAIGSGAVAAGTRAIAIGKAYASGTESIAIQNSDSTSTYGAQAQNSGVYSGALNKVINSQYGVILGGVLNTVSASGDANGVILSSSCTVVDTAEHCTVLASNASDISGASENSVLMASHASTLNHAEESAIIGSLVSQMDGGASLVTACAMVGGRLNQITGAAFACGMVGGDSNAMTASEYCGITGGKDHVMTANALRAGITGGDSHYIDALRCGSTGGYGSTISGDYAGTVGGYFPEVSGDYSAVVGGDSVVISGARSGGVGGTSNTISGALSAALGGTTNTVAAGEAVALGGDNNNIASTATGAAVMGSGSYADKAYQHTFSAGGFAAQGDAQGSRLQVRNVTSNATQTELYLDGSTATKRLTMLDDTTWMFMVDIVARRTDADNESAAYQLLGCIDRNAGTVALVGSVTKTVIAEDTAAWDVTAVADNTNKSLNIKVTGEAAKTIRWVATVRLTEVTG